MDRYAERGRAMIVSVNTGLPRTVEWQGRSVTSAIWKTSVDGPVSLKGVNFDGDDQADRRVHGGVDKAVYAYAVEDYEWWSATTGPLPEGTFGENLTTSGVNLTDSDIGDRWHVGSAVLEVAQPREPCYKLGVRMNDEQFPGKFAAAHRPGLYLRIVTPGDVTAGDIIDIEPAALPAIRIRSLSKEDIDAEVLRQAVDDPRVPDGWRRTAARFLSRL